jgi:hypothetical protein
MGKGSMEEIKALMEDKVVSIMITKALMGKDLMEDKEDLIITMDNGTIMETKDLIIPHMVVKDLIITLHIILIKVLIKGDITKEEITKVIIQTINLITMDTMAIMVIMVIMAITINLTIIHLVLVCQ